MPESAITVVGIGADGWPGLAATSRQALRAAEVVIGGPRQLALLPAEVTAQQLTWPSPLRPAVPGLLAAHAGRRVAVLASGDPMFYGIGRTLAETVGAERLHVLPHPSSVSYACARLGWPVEETEVVTAVGRPLESVRAALHPGRRLLVLSADAATPARLAALLAGSGWGPSRLRVLEQLGGEGEDVREGTADGWPHAPGDPLNVVAVECAAVPGTPRAQLVPGLPDGLFESDGQLTKRHIRAATLAALAPAPANCSGTWAAAPARSASSGCAHTVAAAPSAWSATRSGPGGSPATRPPSAYRACAWSAARRPPPWPAWRPRTPSSSAADSPPPVCSTPAGTPCRPADGWWPTR